MSLVSRYVKGGGGPQSPACTRNWITCHSKPVTVLVCKHTSIMACKSPVLSKPLWDKFILKASWETRHLVSGSHVVLNLCPGDQEGDFNIRGGFKSGPSFHSLPVKIKDPLPIYEVPCTCGEVYIGKTTCSLETHPKEHKDKCIKCFVDKPALYNQLNTSGRRTNPSAGMTLGCCSMLAKPWS